MNLTTVSKWIGIVAIATVTATTLLAAGGEGQKRTRFKGRAVASKAALDRDVQLFRIVAAEGKITPDTIEVERFKQVRIQFVSKDATYRIRFKAFGIKEKLTPEEPVVVDLMPNEPGPYEFGCTKSWGLKRYKNNGTMVVH